MVDEAERLTAQAGVAGWVKHKCADSVSLPFDASTFDSCRSERLFQHLLEPERALSEMIRVTKTDGFIVVLDTDWGSSSTDTAEVDIERRLARLSTERTIHKGYAGRQLYRLFNQGKLADVRVESHPLLVTDYSFARHGGMLDEAEQIALAEGVVTEDELQRWHTSLEQANSQDVFFASVNQIMAVGRKP